MIAYWVMALPLRATLLGEGGFAELGSRFRRGGSSIDQKDLWLLLAGLAFVAMAIWLLHRYLRMRQRRDQESDHGLFLELCRAHQIGRTDRRLLVQLASCHQLSSPAQLFVDPRRFDPKNLAGALEMRREELARLRKRLFESSE